MNRLIVLAFYVKTRNDEGDLVTGFNLDVDGPTRGELFAITDFLDLDEEQLAQLKAPHSRLFELLNATDTIQPIAADTWHRNSMESLARIEQAFGNLKAKQSAGVNTP